MKNENALTNEILYGGKFIPHGDRMMPATQTPKLRKPAMLPDYARFKLVLEYSNTGKRLWYPSLEFSKDNCTEEQAYDDLRRRIIERKNPDLYNFITVWMSFSDKLNWRNDKTYDFECYTVKAGMNLTTERRPVFFPSGQVDIWATKCKYKLPEAIITIEDQERIEQEFHRKKLLYELQNKMKNEAAEYRRKNKKFANI